jgi:dTDP-4-dehydrorhamnose reductase
MAVILVTGANGQLGSELRQASRNFNGYDFTFTDIAELDITDADKTREFIGTLKPDWIINCAAYNAVDKAESEAEAAMLINSTSVKNIAEAIKESDCRFFHVSTDYVFSGEACVPYVENSPTVPQTAYGRSKLAGEREAVMHNRTMIIRTSWLYSAYGSNFVRTILARAAENKPLRVVFDQVGTPTWAAGLAEAIMSIISRVVRNQTAFLPGIYHYSDEGVCSWYDFAVAIIGETQLDCKVIPIRSSEFISAAKRPYYSVLDKGKIKENYNIEIQHWRTNLGKCIKQII